MSLLDIVRKEISEQEWRIGQKQCFIGHKFSQVDLRRKLEISLNKLEMKAYFADQEMTEGYILTKICKKILTSRASIMDLTSANPNVYFELGLAIGLNKPVFLIRQSGATVPSILENFFGFVYTAYADLENALTRQVPAWLQQTIEQGLLYKTYCHFVGVQCQDRLRISPARRYLVLDQIQQAISHGQVHYDYELDLRLEVASALQSFAFEPNFLEQTQQQDTFRLCDYCRAIRTCDFVLCHLSLQTSLDVYLLLGLITGMEIPSLLMVRQEPDRLGQLRFEVPSMLSGLDAFAYQHYTEVGERLGDAIEGFLNRHHSKPLPNRVIDFPNALRRDKSKEAEESSDIERASWTDAQKVRIAYELARMAIASTVIDALLERPTVACWEEVWQAAPSPITTWVPDVIEAMMQTGYNYLYMVQETNLVLVASFSQNLGGSPLSQLSDTSVASVSFRENRSLYVSPIGGASFTPHYPNTRSSLTFPLQDPIHNAVLGVLGVESETAAFSERDQETLRECVSALSGALTRRGEISAPQPVKDTGEPTLSAPVTPSGIVLSERAAEEIRGLLERQGKETAALRVFVSGGGDSGLNYGMAIDDSIEEGDLVFNSYGVKVVVDALSINYIRGASVDYVEDMMGGGFKIDNPNAVRTSEDGSSFTTEDTPE